MWDARRGRSRRIAHCVEYVAELLGFLPVFAYLAGLHPRLVVPRRTVPRPRVAAGSVALAGEFSAVYPWDSPGGWHLLGRVVGVDNELVADTGNLECGSSAPCGALGILPGDRVQFFPMRAQDAGPAAPRLRPLAPDAPGAGLVVEQTALSATVQDQGRSGQLARGLPPSGPLDPDTFARAQAAVGNAPTHAAIEVWRGTLTVRARGSVVVSADGSPPRQLRDGERLSIGSPQGLSYLAVLGGVEVPLCAGSRATLVVARWGGFAGRSLRVGDVVPVADQPRAEPNEPGFPSGFNPCPALLSQLSCDKGVPIVIDPGPHLDRFPSGELERFVSSKFIVSASSDRVGQRLEGTRVPRTGGDLALPTPMTRGAVQVTTDGTPIVLGPDHPTTGGYPVIGVVRRTSWGALAHKTPGEVVRFTLG
jgi:biotin-dependent carboxylase-like uncharacterized protein